MDAVDTITTGHTLECHAAKIVDPQARLESLHQRGDKGFSARPT